MCRADDLVPVSPDEYDTHSYIELHAETVHENPNGHTKLASIFNSTSAHQHGPVLRQNDLFPARSHQLHPRRCTA